MSVCLHVIYSWFAIGSSGYLVKQYIMFNRLWIHLWLWMIVSTLTKNPLSLPATLSLSVASHYFPVLLCPFVVLLSGSLCLPGTLNVRVFSSALRLFSLCVTRVIMSVLSLYLVFGLLCQNTACTLHAKLWETCFPGILSVLSSKLEYWCSAATSHRFMHKLTAHITQEIKVNFEHILLCNYNGNMKHLKIHQRNMTMCSKCNLDQRLQQLQYLLTSQTWGVIVSLYHSLSYLTSLAITSPRWNSSVTCALFCRGRRVPLQPLSQWSHLCGERRLLQMLMPAQLRRGTLWDRYEISFC